MTTETFAYDSVPYTSGIFQHTSPVWVAAIADLHGINAASPDDCRVLEIGCGDGTNLLHQAFHLPDSQFVGVDLSAVHIAAAMENTAQLGLRNVEFIRADLVQLDLDSIGKFDYINAHGLYTWVPDFVRERILEIYRECLKSHGVGYISYNTFPGCHLRRIAWDMAKYHTRSAGSVEDKIAGTFDLMEMIQSSANKDTYNAVIGFLVDGLKEKYPQVMYHDDLAELNEPFYFHEFASHISAHGLQYLSDADPENEYGPELTPNIHQWITERAPDVVSRGQYMDFVRGTGFRRSLICHESNHIHRERQANRVIGLSLSSSARPSEDAGSMNEELKARFTTYDGKSLETSDPLTKAALTILGQAFPLSFNYPDLLEQSLALAGALPGESEIELLSDLFECYRAGIVNLGAKIQSNFTLNIGERPVASEFVRWQIRRNSSFVTPASGYNFRLEPAYVRELIILLDGTRTLDEICEQLRQRVRAISKDEVSEEAIDADIRKVLAGVSRYGLLVA